MRRSSPAAMAAAALAILLSVPCLEASPQARRQGRRAPGDPALPDARPAAGPDVGDPAPAVTLRRLDGTSVRLSDYWAGTPLLVVLGSFTSPEFREHARAIERIQAEVGGVAALVVYTLEAYPAGGKGPYGESATANANAMAGASIPAHKDLEARRAAASLAIEKLTLGVPVLVDGMDDAAWKAFGGTANPAFLIDAAGYVVARQATFDPADMEATARMLQEMLRQAEPAAPPPPAKPKGGPGGE